MMPIRPCRARSSRALPALLCLSAVLLAACHSSNNPPPGTPVMTMSQASDRTEYAAYIVSIDSVSFTQADGSVVTPLATAETVDLTKLHSFTELVEAPAVPSGTYTSVTLVIDYSSAFISINRDGDAWLATPVGPGNATVTSAAVTVTLDPNNPLIVNTNEAVRLNLDISLDASNTITNTGDPAKNVPATILVQPFVVASVAPVDNTVMRARGVFITTQTLTNAFYMNLRPFYDLFSQLGAVIVNVSPTTYWQINGNTYTGLTGLTQMPRQQANVPVVAYGTLDNLASITPTFNASSIYVGTSQENPTFEYLTGTVAERSGDTLQLKAATYNDPSGVTDLFDAATVTVADSTLVTEDGVAAPGLSINSISVGQQVNVSGLATISATQAITLDASTGQVRIQQTPIWGTLTALSPTQATLNVGLINNFTPNGFNFSGTGSSSANNANPASYLVDVSGLNTTGLTPGDSVPVLANGIVSSFGSAPPDFIASSITPGEATEQTLLVEWGTDATAPFSSVSDAGLAVNLQSGHIGTTHIIRTGSGSVDLDSLPASPLITTTGADQSNLQLAIGSAVATNGISVFNSWGPFEAAVKKTFPSSNGTELYRLVAYGKYNSATNQFVASRIYLSLREPTG